jgi:hypothetical protein
MVERTGNWMATNSGNRLYFNDPKPEDINIFDIATSLSKLCRFTGQIDKLYTVAQHSVLVSHFVPEEYALEGLLHDAAEAYTNDINTPLKRDLGESYRSVVEKIEWVIANKYGLVYPWPVEVHYIDHRICTTEAKWLFPTVPEWVQDRPEIDFKVPIYGTLTKLHHNVWKPKTAYNKFIVRLKELLLERFDDVA